jgi:gliding motility-associated-like protein
MKKLLPFLFTLISVVGWGQCDVFIEPGSVLVTDNGSGIKFEFDITNNSGVDWYGDVLKLNWTLNSSAPIWNIDYSTNTSQPPIAPGETRTIKTPWFDFPNLPSWFPNDPTAAQPWEESVEWAYYGLGFPFQGSWAPMNLRLGSCTLAEGAWIYNLDGTLYYGSFNSNCPDLNNDAFCDCDVDFISFNPITLDLSVEVISHWNCGQTLNNGPSSIMLGVNHLNFGLHVPGWDFQWGCTTNNTHPGWTFVNYNIFSNSDYLIAGDVFNTNLLDLGPDAPCFQEILSSDTLLACPEIVIWQINYSRTLNVNDGGWAVNYGTDNSQEYPDNFLDLNVIDICEIPVPTFGCTDENASNYDPIAESDDGSCEYFFPDADPNVSFFGNECVGEEYDPTYGVFVYNYGEDTLYQYCVEIPELDVDTCLDGNILGAAWVEPGAAQFMGLYTIPDSITQFTVTVYNVGDEYEGDNINNIQVVNVNQPPDNPCIVFDPLELDFLSDMVYSYGGTCTDPFYNQNFFIENTGVGIIDSLTFNLFVTTWDNEFVFQLEQDYYPSLLPGDTLIIDDIPDIFTGDLNYIFASISWIDENGELQSDTQSFDILLYCWGCTDPLANNYINSPYVFDAIPDYWLNDFPDTTPPTPDQIECIYDIYGCTDEAANNYNPDANVDDGSCTYDIPGCTDPEANNYDPTATIDDGSCTYDILGCTDPIAINYNPFANVDDSSCEYDVPGCTDPLATNYNPLATVDDGSCEYIIYLGGCTDPEAINYNAQATYDDGSCVYDPCNGIVGAVYYAPNTFTPNNDGVNDGWTVVTNPECWLKWQVLIYNRWGQLIWESTTPGEIWPGSTFDGGYYVADGVYLYLVKGIGYNPANTFQTTGSITVFR